MLKNVTIKLIAPNKLDIVVKFNANIVKSTLECAPIDENYMLLYNVLYINYSYLALYIILV